MELFSKIGILVVVNLLLSISIQQVNCAHILFLHTCVSYSHRVSSWPFIEALVAKNHKITFIGPFPPTVPNPNVTEIAPKRLTTYINEVLNENFDVTHRASGLTPKFIMVYDYICYNACNEILRSEEFQKWMQSSPKVDLIISDTVIECSLGLAQKLNSKHALFLPLTYISKHFDAFGILPETAIPDWDITFKPPLSFLGRVIGSLIPLIWRASQNVYYIWYESLFKETLALEQIPNLDESLMNTSLIYINGDYILDYPRSYPPFVVKTPALHVKEQNIPLEDDLETFIISKNSNGTANDGFIYLSFGTVAKAPSLPLPIREVFFKSIEAFPNIRFIWRWDGPSPSKFPKNLYLKKWLQQEDLLAHPNIRGFITQAGRPSLQEALKHRVPTITFPLLGEQDFNAHRFEFLGISINLDVVGITKERLEGAISQILNDERYKKRTDEISSLAKDVQTNPVATAVWWTEFVLRHSQEELNLLKPFSMQQWWFQKRELDVWTFIAILCITFITLAFHIISFSFQLFWKKVVSRAIDKTKKS